MPVRLLRGDFLLLDGNVSDDFEALPTGDIILVPQVDGNAGCVLFVGSFSKRLD